MPSLAGIGPRIKEKRGGLYGSKGPGPSLNSVRCFTRQMIFSGYSTAAGGVEWYIR